jgi:hypothetical protein
MAFNLCIPRIQLAVAEDKIRKNVDKLFAGKFVERVVNIQKKEQDVIYYTIQIYMFKDKALTEEAAGFYKAMEECGQLYVNHPEGTWMMIPLNPPDKKLHSLFIPRVNLAVSEDMVTDVFNTTFDGEFVQRVVFKPMTDPRGVQYHSVAVHMHQDRYPQITGDRFYKELAAKTQTKEPIVVFTGNGKEYWKVYPFKVKTVEPVDGIFSSVCIPRAVSSTSLDDVRHVFNKLLAGNFVDFIDFKEKVDPKGIRYLTLFVHFFQDKPATSAANKFYADLYAKDADKDHVKVPTGVRDHFWKVVVNKTKTYVMTEEEEKEYDIWRAKLDARSAKYSNQRKFGVGA